VISPPQVVTVTLNPALDQTLSVPGFAAGQVNRVAASRTDPGGKGVNVACFLADLGQAVAATGFLGEDNAAPFEELFDRKGIDDRFVRLPGATRVGIKVVDEQAEQTTDLNFPGLAPGEQDLAELLGRVAALAEPGVWVVLSGSVPAGVSADVYARLIEVVHRQGARVVLDTSGPPLRAALAARPAAVKPNAAELAELVGRALGTVAEVRAAGASLLERGVGRVVVSMGAEGALFLEDGQAVLARPPRVAVQSSVGAGDALVGGLVFAQLRGLPLEEAARIATGSGAYAVTRIGPGIADLAEHRALIERVEIEAWDGMRERCRRSG